MTTSEARQRIAGNLRTIAKAKRIKQVTIANACKVSKGAVSNWFKGTNSIDIDYIPTIANTLGVSVDVLLGNAIDADTASLLSVFSKLDKEARERVISFATFELENRGTDSP